MFRPRPCTPETCHIGSVSISGMSETMVPHDFHFVHEGVRHVTLGGAERLARCGRGGRGALDAADLFNEA